MGEQPLDTIDIVSPELWADEERIHAAFSRLRREDPVHWTEAPLHRPFWAVTRHADIIEIERQHDKFLNAPRLTIMPIAWEEKVKAMTGGNRYILRMLVDMDEPEHQKFRALTQGYFYGAGLKRLEPLVQALAARFVDRMAERGGQCDFVADVARWYPLHVIMSLIGIPEEDEARMLKLTQELFGGSDPDLRRTAELGVEVIMDFLGYFDALTQDRRKRPRDDLASVIANGRIDGELLGPLEAASYFVLIATAGHDTTSATLSGALDAFLDHSQELARLKADLALLSTAIDEIVRWVSPVRHFFRTARDDYVLGGKKIAAGDSLALFFPSGNRDEGVFRDPFAFRVDRKPNPHLAFGHGVHHCLGHLLARMELRAFLAELLQRLKRLERAGPAQRIAGNFVGGLKSLPIRYALD
jgi:hypothetical protein